MIADNVAAIAVRRACATEGRFSCFQVHNFIRPSCQQLLVRASVLPAALNRDPDFLKGSTLSRTGLINGGRGHRRSLRPSDVSGRWAARETLETPSLPTLSRSYPRHFAFYGIQVRFAPHPIRSIETPSLPTLSRSLPSSLCLLCRASHALHSTLQRFNSAKQFTLLSPKRHHVVT